ncbi:MAG: delta-aminovaleramide aminohydrolase [Gammaproteobacteria bacterium]|nr:delta-aminovaleramide aminohydrolase [Gammaproteobacteria bacterium]
MKLALWQTGGFPAEVAANLAALATTAQAAAAAGAELLLCPECWLCGYNIGAAVATLAEQPNGPSAQHIAGIARRNGIAIAYGYAEREIHSGRIYNSVQVIGPDGAVLSHYRKTHLFGPDERAAYQPGPCFEPPFEFGGLRFGLLICYDVEYPEAVRSVALLGADVVLVPTALAAPHAEVPDFIVPARSIENQLFVAYCNHAGVANGMRFLGGSCLTGPDGSALAAAGTGEALIMGEISKQVREEALQSYSYRRDRRPDLYGLLTSNSDVRC